MHGFHLSESILFHKFVQSFNEARSIFGFLEAGNNYIISIGRREKHIEVTFVLLLSGHVPCQSQDLNIIDFLLHDFWFCHHLQVLKYLLLAVELWWHILLFSTATMAATNIALDDVVELLLVGDALFI